jgi:hypothetical protein
MEVTCISETSDEFEWTAYYYSPEDRTLLKHRCENLESYKLADFFNLLCDTTDQWGARPPVLEILESLGGELVCRKTSSFVCYRKHRNSTRVRAVDTP